ncbi:F510_1955 family glycosylhydrolase [Geodermatophilus nigrescens]
MFRTCSAQPAVRARAIAATVGTAAAVVLTGCSSADPVPAAAPATSAAAALALTHVHGAAFDPGDGALLLATHHGLLTTAGRELTEVGPVIDLMGFTVVGPGHYLASGHPGLQVTDLPNPVGLVESTDGGASWVPLSRGGESDFHALTTAADGAVLGFDGVLRRSIDGRTWEQLALPGEPHTLTAAPGGGTVLATTAQGLLRSADGGTTWTSDADAPLLQVAAWADERTAVGVDPAGTLWTSSDGAVTWLPGRQLGTPPQAVAATAAENGLRIAVVTADAVFESNDGGTSFTAVLDG